jgi:hypothetical protein
MEKNLREERRKIFRQELFSLKEGGYISDAIAETVAHAHHAYHLDLIYDEINLVPSHRKRKCR